MTRTEILALADRNDAHAELHEQELPHDDEQRQWAADMRSNAALLRKLAVLQPVAWHVYIPAEERQEYATELDELVDELTNCECETTALYSLTEVLTDEGAANPKRVLELVHRAAQTAHQQRHAEPHRPATARHGAGRPRCRASTGLPRTVGRKTAICAVCVDRSHDERHTAILEGRS